jgi:oligosaccharyltransferase complex subunit beta
MGGKRTLVLLEDMDMRLSHSLYFDSLTNAGFELSFYRVGSEEVELDLFGDYLYDNVIMFVPSHDEFGSLQIGNLHDFLQQGGNLLLATSPELSETVRSFAASCGIEFDSYGSQVIDHLSYSPDQDTQLAHTAVSTSSFLPNKLVLPKINRTPSPVVFRGVGHAVDTSSILSVPLLTGNPSSYSADPTTPVDGFPDNAGEDTVLVSGVQARNNARVSFSGSIDLFSNAFWTEGTGNAAFCQDVTFWTFAQQGVLRVAKTGHQREDGSQPDIMLHEKERPDLPTSLFPDPEITKNSLVYRIADNVTYWAAIELLDEGIWTAYKADDMQLEVAMLDPYIRTFLSHDDKGTFSTTVKIPDVYGVYQLRVIYKREGLSWLKMSDQVAVRPFKHNEYDRFIPSAYPYYTATFCMMAGFFVFSAFFLFTKDGGEEGGNAKLETKEE